MNGNDFGTPAMGGTNASNGSNSSGCSGTGSGSGGALQGLERGMVPEFPRECLKFIEKIGDGDFGEVGEFIKL